VDNPQILSNTTSDINVTVNHRPRELPRLLIEDYLPKHPKASTAELQHLLKQYNIERTDDQVRHTKQNIRRTHKPKKVSKKVTKNKNVPTKMTTPPSVQKSGLFSVSECV